MEQAKVDMILQDYPAMAKTSQQCIALYPDVGNCYFLYALSNIYLGQITTAEENLQIAKAKNFDMGSVTALNQLVGAYSTTKQYPKLAEAYQELILRRPNVPDYHASLAFAYREMGQYQKARQEALIFLPRSNLCWRREKVL